MDEQSVKCAIKIFLFVIHLNYHLKSNIDIIDTGVLLHKIIKENLLRLNYGAMCPHCISVKQKNNEMMQ